MKNKSRRIFLRNTSLATTGVLLMSPLGATKKTTLYRQAIGCAPESFKSLTGTLGSARSGKWSDPSTWGGKIPNASDTPVISAGHIVDFDLNTAIVAGININSGGELQFNNSRSAELQSTKNIVVQGKLVMKPSSTAVKHRICFIGISESNFVGGGHNVLDSDIGLWVMGAGQLDLAGTKKKGWSRTTGSVSAGSSRLTVEDGSGWTVGDDIVLVPTDTPGPNTFNWDDRSNTYTDTFAVKFERRKIIAVSGNTFTVDLPFLFNHDQVSTGSGKTWTPEVANLSRNVSIEGTATGRSHIFIRSSVPQHICYISGRHLGPRKIGGRGRPELVTGRYGLHFHHCGDGSIGSMVEGCAIYDLGNRVYVPHMSHGITMNNNVAFNCMEASFWWDFQELSHNITWEGNLTALVSQNGIDGASRGMELNMGDGNVANNNVVVYGHSGDEHNLGAYAWNANSEGVWIFENNLSHSNRSGLFVWQNTSNNHTVTGHVSYNDHLGLFHGAYINSYTYTNCIFYNSLVRVKATSGNSSGVRFEKTLFDGANQRAYVAEIYPSPVSSGDDYNAFRECTFKNYSQVAVLMNTFPVSNEIPRKHVCLIKCNFSGKMLEFTKESQFDSKFFIQPASGPCTMISQTETKTIASFAPYLYGDGTGLRAEYFNGSNFDKLAYTRIDSMIMFQQWTYDKGASPTQVHHRITGDGYSMRWTGKVEAQYTESYQFRMMGSGGFRLWVNHIKIIDSWTDRADNKDIVTSSTIDLIAGLKYDIKIEHMNMGGARGCQLFWECKSIGRSIHIPQSQLYSDTVIVPVMIMNRPVAANAGADITITLPIAKVVLDASASSPASSIKLYEWSQISGPGQVTIQNKNAATSEVSSFVEGSYIFKLQVTDIKGSVTNDEVAVNVKPAINTTRQQPVVANAGTDKTLVLPLNSAVLDGSASSPAGSIKSYEWLKVSGPTQVYIENKNAVSTGIKDLVEGTYVFRLQITDKQGVITNDDTQVIVKPEPPLSNAGSDAAITLPTNSIVLNGSGSFAKKGIKTYEWSKISGPANYQIINKNAISPVIKDLQIGTYVFQLQITDKSGVTAEDQVTVVVNPAKGTNKDNDNGKNNNQKQNIVTLDIKASPNPSHTSTPCILEVTSDSDLPINISVYGRRGNVVSRYPNLRKGATVRWGANYERGTYYAIAKQGNLTQTIKLIKL